MVAPMEGRRPLVAVSIGFADYGDYTGFGYGRPLLAAGALPVLLPFYEREQDRVALVNQVDGLVPADPASMALWRTFVAAAAERAEARRATRPEPAVSR